MGNQPSAERELLRLIAKLPRGADGLAAVPGEEEPWRPLLRRLCEGFHPFYDAEHAAFLAKATFYGRMRDGGALEGVAAVLGQLCATDAPAADLEAVLGAAFRLLCAPHLAVHGARDERVFAALRNACAAGGTPAVAALQVLHKLMVAAHQADPSAAAEMRAQCFRRGGLDLLQAAIALEPGDPRGLAEPQRRLLALDALCEAFVWDAGASPGDATDHFWHRLLEWPDAVLQLSRHPEPLLAARATIVVEACLLRCTAAESAAFRETARHSGALLWHLRRALDLICDAEADEAVEPAEGSALLSDLMVPLGYAPKAVLRRAHRDVVCLLCAGHRENAAALARALPARLLRRCRVPLRDPPRASRLPYFRHGPAARLAQLGARASSQVPDRTAPAPPAAAHSGCVPALEFVSDGDIGPRKKRSILNRLSLAVTPTGKSLVRTLAKENWVAVLDSVPLDEVGPTIKWDAEARQELHAALQREEEALDERGGKGWDVSAFSVGYAAEVRFLRVGDFFVDALVWELGHRLSARGEGWVTPGSPTGHKDAGGDPVAALLARPVDGLWRLYERIVIDERRWHRVSCVRAMRLVLAAQTEALSCVPVMFFVEMLCRAVMVDEDRGPANDASSWGQLVIHASDVRDCFREGRRREPTRAELCREVVLMLQTLFCGADVQTRVSQVPSQHAEDFLRMRGLELLLLLFSWPVGPQFRVPSTRAPPGASTGEAGGGEAGGVWERIEGKGRSVAALSIRLMRLLVLQCPSAIAVLTRPRHLRRLIAALGLLAGLHRASCEVEGVDEAAIEELLVLLELVLEAVPAATSGLYSTGFFHYLLASAIHADGRGAMHRSAARLLKAHHLSQDPDESGPPPTDHSDAEEAAGARGRAYFAEGASAPVAQTSPPIQSTSAFRREGLAGALGFGKGLPKAPVRDGPPAFALQHDNPRQDDVAVSEDSPEDIFAPATAAAQASTPSRASNGGSASAWDRSRESYLLCLLPRGLVAALLHLPIDEFCRVFNAPAVDTPDIFWDPALRRGLRRDIEALLARSFRRARPLGSGESGQAPNGADTAAMPSLSGIEFMNSIGVCTTRSEESLPRLAAFPTPHRVHRTDMSLAPADTRPRFESMLLGPFFLAQQDDDFLVPPAPGLLGDFLRFAQDSAGQVPQTTAIPAANPWSPRPGGPDPRAPRTSGTPGTPPVRERRPAMRNVDQREHLRVALAAAVHLYTHWPACRTQWRASAADELVQSLARHLQRDRGALAPTGAGLALCVAALSDAPFSQDHLIPYALSGLETALARLAAFAARPRRPANDTVWLVPHQVPALAVVFFAMACVKPLGDGGAWGHEGLRPFQQHSCRYIKALGSCLGGNLRSTYPGLSRAVVGLVAGWAQDPTLRIMLVQGGVVLELLGLLLETYDAQRGPHAEAEAGSGGLGLAKRWVVGSAAVLTLKPGDASVLEASDSGCGDDDSDKEGEADAGDRSDTVDAPPPLARGVPTLAEWQAAAADVASQDLLLRVFLALRSLAGPRPPEPGGAPEERDAEQAFRQLLSPGLLFYLRTAKASHFLDMLHAPERFRSPRLIWTPAMRDALAGCLRQLRSRATTRLADGLWPAWDLRAFLGPDGFRFAYAKAADDVVLDDLSLSVVAEADDAAAQRMLEQLVEGEGMDPRAFGDRLYASLQASEQDRERLVMNPHMTDRARMSRATHEIQVKRRVLECLRRMMQQR